MSWGTVSLGGPSTVPVRSEWMWGTDPWVSLPMVIPQCPHPFSSTPVLHPVGSEGRGEAEGYTEPWSKTGTVGGRGPAALPSAFLLGGAELPVRPSAHCSTAWLEV